MWFNRYRWIFLVATIVLLGFAYYQAYKNKTPGAWSRRILHGTTALSLGLIAYTLLTT